MDVELIHWICELACSFRSSDVQGVAPGNEMIEKIFFLIQKLKFLCSWEVDSR